jgi:hypothetical protein
MRGDFENFSFGAFFLGFLLLTFLGAFLIDGINEFEISIKFCVFLIPSPFPIFH